jgi:hypothetical protein
VQREKFGGRDFRQLVEEPVAVCLERIARGRSNFEREL